MANTDAILIPGGGLTEEGNLPPWTISRIQTALSLHQDETTFLLLSGGTVHKPPPQNEDGFPLFESRVAAEYLLNKGVPPAQIMTEISSYDTIGNAYFSRVLHAQPARWHSLHVVTSQFHVQRVEVVFQWIYRLKPLPHPYQLTFHASPNDGLGEKLLTARQQKESTSLQKLLNRKQEITSLQAFHNWFYTDHTAYAVGKQPHTHTGDLADSY